MTSPNAWPEDPPDRLRSFAVALEAVRASAASRVGPSDVARVRRLSHWSRAFEVAGRLLLHFGLGPISFAAGVALLWLRKQLHTAEIGHTVLHGTYDRIGGGRAFSARSFSWDTPIDEASWRYGHNVRHHGATNVAGRDADMHLGPVRLSYHTAFHPAYRIQFWQLLATILPGFLFWMGAHFSGVIDLICGNCRPERFDFLPNRSWASVKTAVRRSGRKWVPYYLKNWVFFPVIAGANCWRVLCGNILADLLCNLFTGCGIISSHNGAQVKTFATGTKPSSQGEWYAMQVEATNNFHVSYPVSVLLGGLDYQIEHHLFPTLPPEKLREIAPEVRRICLAHGVEYRLDSWSATLLSVFKQVWTLAREDGTREHYPAMGWLD